MRELHWNPKTNDELWPRLMAALRQVMADNFEIDPEIDRASALDALDVPYELDEKGEPQIDPVGTWPISALREIAPLSGKSIDYLLGDGEGQAERKQVRPTAYEESIDAAFAAIDRLNAITWMLSGRPEQAGVPSESVFSGIHEMLADSTSDLEAFVNEVWKSTREA